MGMWNWLSACYKEGSLTMEDLQDVMSDDKAAWRLWDDWACDSDAFVDFVRDEVQPFIKYIEKKRIKEGYHGD
jgi:hypothetical protein